MLVVAQNKMTVTKFEDTVWKVEDRYLYGYKDNMELVMGEFDTPELAKQQLDVMIDYYIKGVNIYNVDVKNQKTESVADRKSEILSFFRG